MAEHTEHGPSSGGTDLAEHQRTWRGFLILIKWSAIVILLIMGLMAIFRVH